MHLYFLPTGKKLMSNPTTLLYDLTRGFRSWNIIEIYLGPNSATTGQIVPNVDDLVIDWNNGLFRVTALDVQGTTPSYTPTLMLVDFAALMDQNNGVNSRLALYQPSILELAFLNTAVMPFTISIDDKYRTYSSEANYAKLFKGSDLSTNGHVISQTYNAIGELVSENIALELIDPTNPAIKRPVVFNTETALYDGETVTLVLYTATGGVRGEHPFLIKNSSAMRGLNANSVYITDIVLVSNMLDPNVLNLINIPANVPLTGGDFQARLLYSDGNSTLISIGSTKCKLYGIENFNTSIAGTVSTVVLTYFPEASEAAVNISNPSVRNISHVYNIHTIQNTLDFSFKIYVVPYYNAESQTYSNKYYLTNITYSLFIELTPAQITVTKQGGGFIDYGINGNAQTLVLSVLMSEVIAFGYTGYTFVQSVTISYGSIAGIGWIIDYLNNNQQVFGEQAEFSYSTQGQQAISILSGALSIEEWLSRLWESLHAIYDESLGLSPPTPTHFQLRYHGILSPIRVIADYYNILLPNYFSTNWVNYDTVEVVFLKPTVDITVYSTLAVAPVRIRNTLT